MPIETLKKYIYKSARKKHTLIYVLITVCVLSHKKFLSETVHDAGRYG